MFSAPILTRRHFPRGFRVAWIVLYASHVPRHQPADRFAHRPTGGRCLVSSGNALTNKRHYANGGLKPASRSEEPIAQRCKPSECKSGRNRPSQLTGQSPIAQRYQANVQAPRFRRVDGLFLRFARDLRAARCYAGWLHARRDLDRLLVVRRHSVWYRRVACHLLIRFESERSE